MVETVVFRLLDMSVINAMILCTKVMPDKCQERQYHKKFRMELAHQLVQPLLDCYADPLRGRPSLVGHQSMQTSG